jgi:hypothetical protein
MENRIDLSSQTDTGAILFAAVITLTRFAARRTPQAAGREAALAPSIWLVMKRLSASFRAT